MSGSLSIRRSHAISLGILALTPNRAMQIVEELLERNFGELELKSDSNYQKVWDADVASLSSAPAGGGESVTQVMHQLMCDTCAACYCIQAGDWDPAHPCDCCQCLLESEQVFALS